MLVLFTPIQLYSILLKVENGQDVQNIVIFTSQPSDINCCLQSCGQNLYPKKDLTT